MGDINKLINWFKAREGKVTYSMPNRLGPYSYDCSSAVFNALIEAGFLPKGTWPGNTEDLYALEGKLLIPIGRNEVKRGDIFVAGIKGGSLGAGGHTGVAVSNSQIIHCNYTGNGITTTGISNNTTYYPCHWYRLKGTTTSPNNNTQKPATPQQKPQEPKIEEEKNMFIYWKQNAIKKDQFDGYFVHGNKRMHMPTTTVLNECRTLVKEWGFNTFEPKYSHDNFRVAAIEKTTDLVKW